MSFYHNIPNPNGENEIQAQKWHKDGMGYKGLDFFISITDINLENGPFFFLKKNNPLGAFSRIENAIPNPKSLARDSRSPESRPLERFKDTFKACCLGSFAVSV